MIAKSQDLKNGKVVSFKIKRRNEEVIIHKGDDEWEKTLKGHIDAVERDIRYITQDIEVYEKKKANWVEKLLPFELKK